MGSGGLRGLQNRCPLFCGGRFDSCLIRMSLKDLPQIEKLLQDPSISRWFEHLGRPVVAQILRITVNRYREDIKMGKEASSQKILAHAEQWCEATNKKRLLPVINATGTILHTNLGRSPLPENVWRQAERINCGYSNLEFDLETGKRGKRSGILPDLLSFFTCGEASLMVNNNAGAMLLMLTVLAKGKEVIVSRGEQVQIGGGFRVPEILELSGARLVEVGTTNITTLKDYLNAVTSNTAFVLQVHTSNFSIRGFAKKPDTSSLVKALPDSIPVMVDQGSGVTGERIKGEISVKDYLSQGASLVCFSGDKILGGPQAGIITGKRPYIEQLARHPLFRAFRPGKTIYSLMEAYLITRLNGAPSFTESALSMTEEDLKRRGRRLQRALPKGSVSIVPSVLTPGGGSAPDETYPSLSLELSSPLPAVKLLKTLREYSIPVIGTIYNDKVRLNLSTLLENDINILKDILQDLYQRFPLPEE